jgi:hypothetical protein
MIHPTGRIVCPKCKGVVPSFVDQPLATGHYRCLCGNIMMVNLATLTQVPCFTKQLDTSEVFLGTSDTIKGLKEDISRLFIYGDRFHLLIKTVADFETIMQTCLPYLQDMVVGLRSMLNDLILPRMHNFKEVPELFEDSVELETELWKWKIWS